MKKTFLKLIFALVFICGGLLFLPMRELCACLSASELVVMQFGAVDMTEPQLAKTVKTRMEGFNIQKDYEEWNTNSRPGNAYSWIFWLAPDGGAPGDCTPPTPWLNGQMVSCRFYGRGNLVRKEGYRLDFRIASDGFIRDVKFYALSNLLGMETIEDIK